MKPANRERRGKPEAAAGHVPEAAATTGEPVDPLALTAQLIGNVLSSSLHVVRNHLTAIRAAAQLGMIRNGDCEGDMFREILHFCDMMNDGIEDLASVGRSGSPPCEVDLRREIEVAVNYAEGRAAVRGARILGELPAAATAVIPERRQLRLAIGLLIDEVIERTGKDATVGVSAGWTEGYTTIDIVCSYDAGAGQGSALPAARSSVVLLAGHLIAEQGGFISELRERKGFTVFLPALGQVTSVAE